MRRSLSYARAPLAVRVSTAVAITAAILCGTAAVRAESRRVVVRVYETGAGDPAIRGAAIRTAEAILDATGIAVEWYDCTANGRRPVCQDARRAGNFIARIMPTLSAAAMPRKASVEALGVQGNTEPPLGFAVVDPGTGSRRADAGQRRPLEPTLSGRGPSIWSFLGQRASRSSAFGFGPVAQR